jgi:hypothetical protein
MALAGARLTVTPFGIRHTIRWALHNAAEFDQRHLHGAGVWLFGQRPVRPRRPVRRIVPVVTVIAWVVIVGMSGLPVAQTFWAALVGAAMLAAGLS